MNRDFKVGDIVDFCIGEYPAFPIERGTIVELTSVSECPVCKVVSLGVNKEKYLLPPNKLVLAAVEENYYTPSEIAEREKYDEDAAQRRMMREKLWEYERKRALAVKEREKKIIAKRLREKNELSWQRKVAQVRDVAIFGDLIKAHESYEDFISGNQAIVSLGTISSRYNVSYPLIRIKKAKLMKFLCREERIRAERKAIYSIHVV